MEGVRTFLESSTIHGLTYISTTKKYARLFWILVVISGFTGSILIIRESFQSWSDSPIKTTIETLPISKIKLPKVTVCPPMNVFTDLNYDYVKTENKTLTEEMRDEMFQYALHVLKEDDFLMNNKLLEDNRFYNWYHGYTQPQETSTNIALGLIHIIRTSATSGVVTTQYYGDKFQPDLVERKLHYKVYVYPPQSVKNNKNVTLHLKLEKVSMNGMDIGSQDTIKISKLGELVADKTVTYTNFTPPGTRSLYVLLQRSVSHEDLETMKLNFMPGFRFSWWYTSSDVEVTPEPKYKEQVKDYIRFVRLHCQYCHCILYVYKDIISYQNIRFVNMVSKQILEENTAWEKIRTKRFDYVKRNADIECIEGNTIPEQEINSNYEKLSELLQAWNVTDQINENTTKNKIEIGGKMYLTLNSCPSFFERLYHKVIYGHRLQTPILSLNILRNTKEDLKIKALNIFAKIISVFGFQYIQDESDNSYDKAVLNRNIFRVKGKKKLQTS